LSRTLGPALEPLPSGSPPTSHDVVPNARAEFDIRAGIGRSAGLKLAMSARPLPPRPEPRLPQQAAARHARCAFRVVYQLIDDLRRESHHEQAELLNIEPEPIGDRRFEALLAVLSEHEVGEAGHSAPEWAMRSSVVLDPPWYVSPYLHALADAESPEPLRARGVLMTAAGLTRV